ncbi:MAG: transporter [Chitinivibrionales bacterium]|nr:transporter [Chitinivibrionales bacterium]
MARKQKRSLRRRLRISRRHVQGLRVLAIFFALLLLSSALVFIAEKRVNGGFDSFFDSLWWTIVTISTVGYGDRVPNTLAGRMVAIGTMIVGVATMWVVTGRVASFILERQMKAEKGLLGFSTMKRHFIICGWKQEMNEVLQAILASNPEVRADDVVLLNKAPQEEIDAVRNDARFEGIRLVHGDFMEERDLQRAGIKHAAKVLVLADYHTPGNLQQLDSKTVMAVMTIKSLNRRAYVCAELLDTKFEKYLQLSHCEEILLSRDFSRAMLASASSGTGLTHVIRELLGKDEGGWVETQAVPLALVGKTYGELKAHFEQRDGAQLIGLLENTGNINDRKREALAAAQKNPDISKLIPDLKAIKTLAANRPVINPPSDYTVQQYCRGIVIRGMSPASMAG